jgi:hypothetical protein
LIPSPNLFKVEAWAMQKEKEKHANWHGKKNEKKKSMPKGMAKI